MNGISTNSTPTVGRRKASEADRAFAFDVKKQALGPYIKQVWGWDEEIQVVFFEKEFNPSLLEIITYENQNIGTIEVLFNSERILINKFYILPDFQGHGIGSKILKDEIANARKRGLCLRLGVLRINPAVRFYERHGFTKVEENETHWIMEWGTNRSIET